jgi:formamidopyrimidine-DNA glycosylase
MPEGAECKLAAEGLARALTDRTITGLQILSGRYAKKPFEGHTQLVTELPKRVVGAGCHGKFIYILLDGGDSSIWSTLGMTGHWSRSASRHARVRLSLDDGTDVYYNDTRNFGTLKWSQGRRMLAAKLKTLGPDMLADDVSHERFQAALLRKPKWTLAQALMDQGVVAGVGNYVKADSLWLAKLSPHRKVDSLSLEEFESLNDSIKRVLRDSYQSQGATIKSYKDFDDNEGGYGEAFLCYGRSEDEDGEEVIREETLDGRTTWWVPTRQS